MLALLKATEAHKKARDGTRAFSFDLRMKLSANVGDNVHHFA